MSTVISSGFARLGHECSFLYKNWGASALIAATRWGCVPPKGGQYGHGSLYSQEASTAVRQDEGRSEEVQRQEVGRDEGSSEHARALGGAVLKNPRHRRLGFFYRRQPAIRHKPAQCTYHQQGDSHGNVDVDPSEAPSAVRQDEGVAAEVQQAPLAGDEGGTRPPRSPRGGDRGADLGGGEGELVALTEGGSP